MCHAMRSFRQCLDSLAISNAWHYMRVSHVQLINDIKPAAEIVRDVVREAEEVAGMKRKLKDWK